MNGDKDKDQDYLDQILQETTEDINININLNDINVDEILAEGDLGGDITGEEGRNFLLIHFAFSCTLFPYIARIQLGMKILEV